MLGLRSNRPGLRRYNSFFDLIVQTHNREHLPQSPPPVSEDLSDDRDENLPIIPSRGQEPAELYPPPLSQTPIHSPVEPPTDLLTVTHIESPRDSPTSSKMAPVGSI